jgi:hypothetical protein
MKPSLNRHGLLILYYLSRCFVRDIEVINKSFFGYVGRNMTQRNTQEFCDKMHFDSD